MPTPLKHLFVFFGQIGETLILKSLLDAYCAASGTPKNSVGVLCKQTVRELVEFLYGPDGYQFFTLNTDDCLLASKGDQAAQARLDEVVAAICAQTETLDRLIQLGCTIYSPWISGTFPLIQAIPSREKIFFQYVIGDAEARQVLHNHVEMLEKSGIYTAVFTIDCYDELANKNTHALVANERILATVFPGFSKALLQLPIIPHAAVTPPPLPAEYVVCHVGCGDARINFDTNSRAKVIALLLKNGLDVVITGHGAADWTSQERIQTILRFMGVDTSHLHLFVNTTTLFELIELARKASFIFSNDTGFANIAHCLGKRLLVLTWPYGLNVFFPYPPAFDSANTRVLWTQPDCPFCTAKGAPGSKFQHSESYPCISAIMPRDVISALHDWISTTRNQ